MKSSNLIIILGIVTISTLGCKTSPPTPGPTQATLPTPQESPYLVPTPQESPYIALTPQESPYIAPTPQARRSYIVPTPQASPYIAPTSPPTQAWEPTSPETQLTLPTPSDISALPTLPEPEHSSPTLPATQAFLPTPARIPTTNDSNRGIKYLPDGDYFYGELPEADRPGSKYVVFRKTGNLIIGQEYYLQTDSSHCFKGTADLNAINNVKIAYFEPAIEGAQWSFDELEPITTNNLHQLGVEQAPDFATNNLRECIRILGGATG